MTETTCDICGMVQHTKEGWTAGEVYKHICPICWDGMDKIMNWSPKK